MAQADLITKDELRGLIEREADVALSIYLPTARVAVEPEENSLRLKNLLGEAHDRLGAHGLRRPDADALLEPIVALHDDHTFWVNQSHGLALFRSKDFFRRYRLPFEVPQTLEVGRRFVTKSLLPSLTSEQYFYILALSQDAVRLLKATRFGTERVEIDDLDMPGSLAEALRYDDLQKPELQHHPTQAPGRTDTGPAAPGGGRTRGRQHAFHGHGDSGDDHKNQVLRFFQAVDRGLSPILAEETVPLIVASVDYLQPIWKQATTYRHVLDDGVEGNPDQARDDELHDRAWPLIESEVLARIHAKRELYNNRQSSGQSSCDLGDVLRSLVQGRVDTLFVRRGEEVWGRFDPATMELTVHDERADGDDDLQEIAAREAITHAGDVHVLEAGEMPCDGPIAAVYRF